MAFACCHNTGTALERQATRDQSKASRRVTFTDEAILTGKKEAAILPQWSQDLASTAQFFFEDKAARLNVARLGRLTIVTWNLQLLVCVLFVLC